MRDGKAISKATKSKYRLASSDRGERVSVRVCYKKKKYTTSCVTSAQGAITLEYEGFTPEDSSNAADHVGANWAAQAVRMARDYLKFQAFSRSGLISQLEYEGFSAEDAAAAADAVGL